MVRFCYDGDMLQARDFLLSWMIEHPLIRLLDAAQREQLMAAARDREYAAGEFIFWQHEPAEGMWVIERGSVKIERLGEGGDSQTLRLLGPGDSFDEIAALDGGANPATASALTGVRAWMLPGELLIGFARQDLRFAEGVIQLLAGRVRMLVQQVEDLSICATDARLARFLLRRAENPSLQESGITRVAIAEHLATTPETISRTLRALQVVGAIKFDRHRIVIVDAACLRDIARL